MVPRTGKTSRSEARELLFLTCLPLLWGETGEPGDEGPSGPLEVGEGCFRKSFCRRERGELAAIRCGGVEWMDMPRRLTQLLQLWRLHEAACSTSMESLVMARHSRQSKQASKRSGLT